MAMVSIQRHRGPDDAGIYVDDRVGLGHARLSIIDLSSGAQPMGNEDGTLWIVYNGEIFNYLELRKDLEGRGHRFRTTSDTEVIVHLFEDRGPDCLKELNGQFAIALWDSVKGELFLARDRMGIRPLHYALRDGRLSFASEVKALFTLPDLPREIDLEALDQIFTFWSPLPGQTIFRGIREIPPGHYLLAKGGEAFLRRYWDVPFTPPDGQLAWPLEAIEEKTRELIYDATRIRLRADVPVGSYLSGGLDSSGIATLVRRNFNEGLCTFGIRFEKTSFDEGPFQKEMVSFLGTRHTEVRAQNREIGTALTDVLWHCEKPLLRTAPVPLYLLSDTVRDQGFKVVLTGEGADEVFGGYDIFRETLVRRFWARVPRSKLRPLLIRKLYPDIFKDPKLGPLLTGFFGKGLDAPEDPFFSHRIRWENTARTKLFFSEDLRAALGSYNGYEEIRGHLPPAFPSWDTLSRAQYLEMVIFLGNYLLSSQGDRVAMAHSVEIRLPFLDVRVVEFMARVPSRYRIWGMEEKYLLKRVFRNMLPERIVRRTKHPYRAPIQEALLSGKNGAVREALSETAIRRVGLFDPQKVGMLVRKLDSLAHASEVDEMALAGIASTQMIHELFFRRFPARVEKGSAPSVLIDRRESGGVNLPAENK